MHRLRSIAVAAVCEVCGDALQNRVFFTGCGNTEIAGGFVDDNYVCVFENDGEGIVFPRSRHFVVTAVNVVRHDDCIAGFRVDAAVRRCGFKHLEIRWI
jgi:hypothetical protein